MSVTGSKSVTNSQIATAIGAVASAAVVGYIIYKKVGKPKLDAKTSDDAAVPEEAVEIVPEPVKEPEPVVVKPVPSLPTPKVEEVVPPKADVGKVEPPVVDIPKVEPPKIEVPKVEPPKIEPPKVEPPKVEPPKVEPPKKEEPKIENVGPTATDLNQNGNNSDDLEILSSSKDKKKEADATDIADDEEEEEVNVGKYGAVLLGVWYDSAASKISVNVVKCRGLKALDVKGTSDPYVKVWMCKNNKEFKKEKTSIKKGRLSPIYNETLVFDLPESDIPVTSLKISVLDDDFGGNDLIGSILLGDDSEPTETAHWNDVFLNIGASITSWHTLRYFS